MVRSWMDPPMIHDETRPYLLPYEGNYLVGQGYDNIGGSHQGLFALDFGLVEGTPILAARAGTVIVSDGLSPGNCQSGSPECIASGNGIVIKHDDDSQARYGHLMVLGACAQVGDEVEQGDVIGRSGNTGYSFEPHLHFQIADTTETPTFADVDGDGIPKVDEYYTSANTAGTDFCSSWWFG